jgi:hypothetical protein
MTTTYRMVSLGEMLLIIAGAFALGAILSKPPPMLSASPRLSECKPATLALTNPETRSQVEGYHNGNEN